MDEFPSSRTNHRAVAVMPSIDYDDQNTLLSPPHSDAQILEDDENSVFSDSSTIGDLAQNGYVNRCPRFAGGRIIIFASIMLSKGFFAWSDQRSFSMFIENRRKLDKCLDSGTGWPLFHFVSIGFRSYFNKNVPVNRIYKYKVVDNDSDDLKSLKQQNKELIYKNKKQSLYKIEFCNIFRNVDNKTETVRHKFVCYKPDGSTYTVTLLNTVGRRHTDCSIFEPVTETSLNLRWQGTTGYTSVFGANDFKLVVLDDDIPHLSTHTGQEIIDLRRQPDSNRRPESRMPVWGMYSRVTTVLPIPKRRVLKLAAFEIGEVEESEEVPFTTEVLTCMCMYLHELESRKERRTPLSTSMNTMPFGDFVI